MSRVAVVAVVLTLTAAATTGGAQVAVDLPKATVFLDLDSKGDVRVAPRKEALRSAEQLRDYLRAVLAEARAAQKVDGKPLAVVRVRDDVADKRIEEVRKLCRDAGFRSGLDENWSRFVFSVQKQKIPAQPQAVVLFLTDKGEFVARDEPAPFRSIDDVKRYIKKALPRAREAAQKAKGKAGRPVLLIHADKLPGTFVQTLGELISFCRDNAVDGPSVSVVTGGSGEYKSRKRLELDP
jgi:hypothetical protein